VAGDFFTEIPCGESLLLLKKVIHDWTDERAMAILRNCRAALPEGDGYCWWKMSSPRATSRRLRSGLTY
jgi:hypothetical protein